MPRRFILLLLLLYAFDIVSGYLNLNNDINSENGVSLENLLIKAEEIARKYEVNFVGTEHLLSVMMSYNDQFINWFKQKCTSKRDIGALRKVLEELIDLNHISVNNKSDQEYECEINGHEGDCVQASFVPDIMITSPCLERSISIIQSIQTTQAVTFVEVLLGIIIAHREMPNAGGFVLLSVCDDSISSILNNLSPAKYQINKIPPRTKDSPFTWSNSIPATDESNRKRNTVKPIAPLSMVDNLPQSPVKGETHWVVPGRILAGSSPGKMTNQELLSIVYSGIDTFVNLQLNYHEYRMADYRNNLRHMATS